MVKEKWSAGPTTDSTGSDVAEFLQVNNAASRIFRDFFADDFVVDSAIQRLTKHLTEVVLVHEISPEEAAERYMDAYKEFTGVIEADVLEETSSRIKELGVEEEDVILEMVHSRVSVEDALNNLEGSKEDEDEYGDDDEDEDEGVDY